MWFMLLFRFSVVNHETSVEQQQQQLPWCGRVQRVQNDLHVFLMDAPEQRILSSAICLTRARQKSSHVPHPLPPPAFRRVILPFVEVNIWVDGACTVLLPFLLLLLLLPLWLLLRIAPTSCASGGGGPVEWRTRRCIYPPKSASQPRSCRGSLSRYRTCYGKMLDGVCQFVLFVSGCFISLPAVLFWDGVSSISTSTSTSGSRDTHEYVHRIRVMW